MFAVESVGMLIMNIGLFGMGMAFGVLGLILAISRSVTKNSDHWAITFSAFAWAIALIIPQVWWSAFIFGMGAFALSLAFMPIVRKMGDSNIFTIAVIAIVLNMLILIGSGAYSTSFAWQDNYDSSLTDIERIVGIQGGKINQSIPESELCQPNELNPDGTPCEPDVISGSFNENLFMPYASVLTIGNYLGKAAAFMGMAILAPAVLTTNLASEEYFKNIFILMLMGFMVSAWQLAIFYKTIMFVINKYGVRA